MKFKPQEYLVLYRALICYKQAEANRLCPAKQSESDFLNRYREWRKKEEADPMSDLYWIKKAWQKLEKSEVCDEKR